MDLVWKFQTIDLYEFMAQRCDYNEMIVMQFLAMAKIGTDAKMITWISSHQRRVTTFAEFATTNQLDYALISTGSTSMRKKTLKRQSNTMSSKIGG